MNSYVIKKYLNGLPHIAEVQVNLVKESNEAEVVDLCNGEGWIRQGSIEEASKSGYQDWKDAAKIGIRSALDRAQQNKKIELVKIAGMVTDTNPETVKVAAELATLEELNFDTSTLEEDLIESLRGTWKK